MQDKKHKQKKLMPLRWSFIFVIAICWVAPIIILLFSTGYFVLTSVTQRTRENIQTSVDNSVRIVATRVEAAIEASIATVYRIEVKDIYNKYLQDSNKIDRYVATQSYLSQQYRKDEKFEGTAIYYLDDPKTMCYTSNSNKSNAAVRFKRNTIDVIPLLSPIIGSKVHFFVSNNSLYLMRNLMDKSYKTYGVLCMEISEELMFNSMKNILMATDVVVWFDKEKFHIFGDCIEDDCVAKSTEFKDMSIPTKGNTYLNLDDGAIIGGTTGTDMYKMQYAIKTHNDALAEEISSFVAIIAAISLMIIPMLLLVVLFFYYKITRPITELTKAAKEIENGNFGVKADGKYTSEEFRYLADSFDEMSDKLKNQFQRLYKEELALRDAKIMALQLQMNPHFLNNTLEIINWEARFSGDQKISRMLEALSTMISATMDRKKQRVVHIDEELSYADAYLYIISERLGKRLKIEKEIDESLRKCYVPRLILQPIIENAVEHGIQPLQEGKITIRIYKTSESIIMEVENDGIMTNDDEEKIEMLLTQSNEGEGEAENLGIRNVYQRLKIIYGEKGKLEIKMNKSQHTLAQIIIPINQQEQEF